MSSTEELLADVQSELVGVSLEYVGEAASDIFVYASMENGTLYFDPFFVVQGVLVAKSKVPGIDTSIPRQKALVNFGTAQLKRLYDGCTELGVAVPTQLKLHYSAETRSLDSDFVYTPQYSNDTSLHNIDLSKKWQSEIRSSLGETR
jgi:hypothetical protein